MAKGNLFLGTAARSVGDVVMYRREGSQVSRVRVRKIANPRTDAQSVQRSYFAPVAKFFSPLAIILERSFEGMNKSKSYSKFLAENVKLARQNGWLLPKGTGFFPLPYKLSQGTIPSVAYTHDTTAKALKTTIGAASAAVTTIGGLSAGFIAMGYNEGDVVTIIVAIKDANNNYFPMAAQFTIDSTSTNTIAESFDNMTVAVAGTSFNEVTITSSLGDVVAGAIIVARFENDKWRRSTQMLVVDSAIMTGLEDAAYKAAAIASYSNTAGDINPLVYLDGESEVFQ